MSNARDLADIGNDTTAIATDAEVSSGYLSLSGGTVTNYITAWGVKELIVTRTDGSTLIHGSINHAGDGGTYTLPAASSLTNKQFIIVELPDYLKSYTPTVQCAGADVIASSAGNDTSIIFDTGSSLSITFRSNGVDTWYI